MGKHYHVYGLGAALVDIEFNVTDNELAEIDVKKSSMTLLNESLRNKLLKKFSVHLADAKRNSSGSIANSVIAIAQFGGDTYFSFKVGDDDNGRFYLKDLQATGVDYQNRQLSKEDITGTALVMITPDAERTLNTFLGVNEAFSELDILPEAIKNSDYIYFEAYLATSPSRLTAVIRAREIAEENGVKIAMSFSDANIVNEFRDQLNRMLGNGIDLVFCNRCEALSWGQTNDINVAIESLKRISRKFAITLGDKGALIYDGTITHNIASCSARVVSTSGAGDMFSGAFLYGITHGYDFPTAGKLANIAAAAVIADYGPRLAKTKQQEILNQWKSVQENTTEQ